MPGLMRWSCRAARPAGTAARFDDVDPSGGTGLLALLRIVGASVPLPLVAAGGIAGRRRRGSGPVRRGQRRPGRHRADARARGRHARRPARAAGRTVPHAADPRVHGPPWPRNRQPLPRAAQDRPRPARTRRSTTRPARSAAAARNAGTPGHSICGPARPTSWRRARPAGEIVREMGADSRRVLRDSTSASADSGVHRCRGRVGRTQSMPDAELLLRRARRPLVIGMGGGGDVVGALATAEFARIYDGAEPIVGGVTWERRPIDPVAGRSIEREICRRGGDSRPESCWPDAQTPACATATCTSRSRGWPQFARRADGADRPATAAAGAVADGLSRAPPSGSIAT